MQTILQVMKAIPCKLFGCRVKNADITISCYRNSNTPPTNEDLINKRLIHLVCAKCDKVKTLEW